MGDSRANFTLNDPHPSIYKLWIRARAEGGSEGEMEDRYRELLAEYGHLEEGTGKW